MRLVGMSSCDTIIMLICRHSFASHAVGRNVINEMDGGSKDISRLCERITVTLKKTGLQENGS